MFKKFIDQIIGLIITALIGVAAVMLVSILITEFGVLLFK